MGNLNKIKNTYDDPGKVKRNPMVAMETAAAFQVLVDEALEEVADEDLLFEEEVGYRDSQGKLICKAQAVYTNERITSERIIDGKNVTTSGRHLKTFHLSNSKGECFDLFSMANPHKVRVVVADSRDQGCYYNSNEKIALIRPLDYPIDFAILLHELGHAAQYEDPVFKEIAKLTGTIGIDESVLKAIPDLGTSRDNAELMRLLEKYKYMYKEWRDEPSEKKQVEMEFGEHGAILYELGQQIKPFLGYGLTTKMAERDATRRAFLWLQKMRKEWGIDLLQKMQGAGYDSLRSYLRQGLEMYEADNAKMRVKQKGRGELGFIPSANLTPQKRKQEIFFTIPHKLFRS